MPGHPGEGLKAARENRVARPEELRRASTKHLSQEVLAGRTGQAPYVRVSTGMVKRIELPPDDPRSRNGSDETLAALYHALGGATPDEWPAGALAEARYLASRWLDERLVGVETALERRAAVMALLDGAEPATAPGTDPRERAAGKLREAAQHSRRNQPDTNPAADDPAETDQAS